MSFRTDVPAFYFEWWHNRLQAGFFDVRNPYYPTKVSRQSLAPEHFDGIYYISKNFAPMLDPRYNLPELVRTFPSVFNFTINPYGSFMEPNVPLLKRRLETLQQLSDIVGPARLMWGYNPLLITERFNLNWHLEALPLMFEEIAPYVSRFSFDVVSLYDKVKRNAPDVRPPSASEYQAIVTLIGELCAEHHLTVRLCPQKGDLTALGIEQAVCMPVSWLAQANGLTPKPRVRPQTLESCMICGSVAHRDVGTYDTCPHLCRYCYANASPSRVRKTQRAYDPRSTMLCDAPRPGDEISSPKVTTYFERGTTLI
ncbi:MAG: DUF1848 family protein [Coriobacteriales bacterium]|nr:DUF1848 family protein [Coriobacteriales bacterium]